MLLYWIWLTTRRGLGPRSILKILTHFSSPQEAFYAQQDDYLRAGLTEQEAQTLGDKDLDRPRQILDDCAQKGIHILTYQDAAYPDRLRNIADAPALLYYKGTLPAFDDEPLVAVIGARKSSLYGLSSAKRLGYQIGACGGIVVSGLAVGGDSMAMTGAISSGRPVVGVLGNGLDIVYPASSQHLYEDAVQIGCLLSEYPPGTHPTRFTFPARNRIISGLSLGVLVVEAAARSGTLITVNHALEQGRDVFAVPGSIDCASCAGSNRLLKEGAILVESGWDVMREYAGLFPDRIHEVRAGQAIRLSPGERRRTPPPQRTRPETAPDKKTDKKAVDIPGKPDYIDIQDLNITGLEAALLTALQDGPLHVDDLIAACGSGPGEALSTLTMLEIKKYVGRLPGNRYELAKK